MNQNFQTNGPGNQRSVCIIGAGPTGLCVAQQFLKETGKFKITILERSEEIGGQWVYTDKVDVDQYGLPVHSSIYRNLRSNLPLKLMEYDDFLHDVNPNGYVGHKYVLKYVRDFAEHFKINQHIKFLHLVTKITRKGEQWSVEYKNLTTSQIQSSLFDVICLCQGRFSNPIIPTNIAGLEGFQGKILHTHTYRSAEEFKGKRAVVLGGGPSGLDISLEISEVALETHLCHRMDLGELDLGPNVIQHNAEIESVDGRTLKLSNGKVLTDIDGIVFATGYKIVLDVVDPSCGVKTDGQFVEGLFMHTINMKNPTMAIFSLMDRVPSFKVFSQQAKFFVRMIAGHFKLPSYEEMLQDVREDLERRQKTGLKPKHIHKLAGDELWIWDKKLSNLGGFKPLSPMYKTLFDTCLMLLGKPNYRETRFLFHDNGETFSVLGNDVDIPKGGPTPIESRA